MRHAAVAGRRHVDLARIGFGIGDEFRNTEVLALAREALAQLGYRIMTAANAEEGLSILQQNHRIDILFSDIVMPGRMNGAQLAVEAMRVRPGIKMLLASSYAPEILEDVALPRTRNFC